MAGYNNIKQIISGGKNFKCISGRGGWGSFVSFFECKKMPKCQTLCDLEEVATTLHDMRQEGKFEKSTDGSHFYSRLVISTWGSRDLALLTNDLLGN